VASCSGGAARDDWCWRALVGLHSAAYVQSRRTICNTQQVHTASGALLRERTQLAASSGYVDDMLAQAQSVTRSLMEQRRVFDNVQVRAQGCLGCVLGERGLFDSSLLLSLSFFLRFDPRVLTTLSHTWHPPNIHTQDKLISVGERFPVVNGLMNAIRRKKSKDTLVLSAVIAGCTVFTIIYLFSK